MFYESVKTKLFVIFENVCQKWQEQLTFLGLSLLFHTRCCSWLDVVLVQFLLQLVWLSAGLGKVFLLFFLLSVINVYCYYYM